MDHSHTVPQHSSNDVGPVAIAELTSVCVCVVQYDCVVDGEMKALSVAGAETRASSSSSSRDGHEFRWLMMLTMSCVGVLLLMTLGCSSVNIARTSRPDVISVRHLLPTPSRRYSVISDVCDSSWVCVSVRALKEDDLRYRHH